MGCGGVQLEEPRGSHGSPRAKLKRLGVISLAAVRVNSIALKKDRHQRPRLSIWGSAFLFGSFKESQVPTVFEGFQSPSVDSIQISRIDPQLELVPVAERVPGFSSDSTRFAHSSPSPPLRRRSSLDKEWRASYAFVNEKVS